MKDTDDLITGFVTIEVYLTPASEQLPEVPLAAVLPVIGLGGLSLLKEVPVREQNRAPQGGSRG